MRIGGERDGGPWVRHDVIPMRERVVGGVYRQVWLWRHLPFGVRLLRSLFAALALVGALTVLGAVFCR